MVEIGDSMLKRKALRKIFITTVTVCILLVIYLIPQTEKEEELNTSLELEYIAGVGTDSIYLLNSRGFLVKTKVLLSSDDTCEKVKMIIDMLKDEENSKIPTNLKGMLPKKLEVLDIWYDEGIVSINLSKDFLSIDKELEERSVEALTYSILNLKGVKGLQISVENESYQILNNSKKRIPFLLTKEFGINKRYDLDNRNGINKVTIYYLEEENDETYYVPVTKYLNDARDKIRIIIDNLTTNYIYELNLMSFLNKDTKLLNYELIDNEMILNFNDSIFNDENQILEEVIYTISYSVFDNYDVDRLVFQVEGEEILTEFNDYVLP